MKAQLWSRIIWCLEELFDPITKTKKTNSEKTLTVGNQTLKALEHKTTTLKNLEITKPPESPSDDEGTLQIARYMVDIIMSIGKEANKHL